MKKILIFALLLLIPVKNVLAEDLQFKDHQPSQQQQLDFALGYLSTDLGEEAARHLGVKPLQRRLFAFSISLLCSSLVIASDPKGFDRGRFGNALVGTGCSIAWNF